MKSILSILVSVSLFSACWSSPPKPDGFLVESIKETHSHTRYCGHYRLGDTWYYAPNHRHTGVCRHALEAGVWILK